LAADQGNAPVQSDYAVCLANGYGVAENNTNAAKYSKLAADQRFAEAQYNYARYLENGWAVALSLEKAAKYYKLAADQGMSGAREGLLRCQRVLRLPWGTKTYEVNCQSSLSTEPDAWPLA
jgi:TPR repeat protein